MPPKAILDWKTFLAADAKGRDIEVKKVFDQLGKDLDNAAPMTALAAITAKDPSKSGANVIVKLKNLFAKWKVPPAEHLPALINMLHKYAAANKDKGANAARDTKALAMKFTASATPAYTPDQARSVLHLIKNPQDYPIEKRLELAQNMAPTAKLNEYLSAVGSESVNGQRVLDRATNNWLGLPASLQTVTNKCYTNHANFEAQTAITAVEVWNYVAGNNKHPAVLGQLKSMKSATPAAEAALFRLGFPVEFADIFEIVAKEKADAASTSTNGNRTSSAARTVGNATTEDPLADEAALSDEQLITTLSRQQETSLKGKSDEAYKIGCDAIAGRGQIEASDSDAGPQATGDKSRARRANLKLAVTNFIPSTDSAGNESYNLDGVAGGLYDIMLLCEDFATHRAERIAAMLSESKILERHFTRCGKEVLDYVAGALNGYAALINVYGLYRHYVDKRRNETLPLTGVSLKLCRRRLLDQEWATIVEYFPNLRSVLTDIATLAIALEKAPIDQEEGLGAENSKSSVQIFKETAQHYYASMDLFAQRGTAFDWAYIGAQGNNKDQGVSTAVGPDFKSNVNEFLARLDSLQTAKDVSLITMASHKDLPLLGGLPGRYAAQLLAHLKLDSKKTVTTVVKKEVESKDEGPDAFKKMEDLISKLASKIDAQATQLQTATSQQQQQQPSQGAKSKNSSAGGKKGGRGGGGGGGGGRGGSGGGGGGVGRGGGGGNRGGGGGGGRGGGGRGGGYNNNNGSKFTAKHQPQRRQREDDDSSSAGYKSDYRDRSHGRDDYHERGHQDRHSDSRHDGRRDNDRRYDDRSGRKDSHHYSSRDGYADYRGKDYRRN